MKTRTMIYGSFSDGLFSFWTAHYGSWAGDKRVIFRVRVDRFPKDRAREKGIVDWDRLLPATDIETGYWKDDHDHLLPEFTYQVQERVTT